MDPPQTKKSKTQSILLLELSNDELFQIISFLFTGESIMFAMSCRALFQKVNEAVETQQPRVLGKWTLRDALLIQERGLHIKSIDQLYYMRNILKKEEKFHDICSTSIIKLDFSKYQSYVGYDNDDKPTLTQTELSNHFEEFLKLFTVKTKGTVPVPMTIHKLDLLTGHYITQLSIKGISMGTIQLYSCLQSMINLKILELSGLTLSDKKEIVLPQFVHLTKFTSRENRINNYVMKVLVSCMPNLVELCFIMHEELYKCSFLTTLLLTNPKLKKLKLRGCCELSAKQQLCLVSSLGITHLNIDQDFISNIGKYGSSLEYLLLDRGVDNPVAIDHSYFGSYVMPKLKTLRLKGGWDDCIDEDDLFVDTLIHAAPNLQELILERRAGICVKRAIKLVQAFDLTKFHMPAYEDVTELMSELQRKTNLKDLWISGKPFLVNELEKYNFPSVQVFHGNVALTKQSFDALHKAFPNLTEIGINQSYISKEAVPYDAAVPYLDPNFWPNLTKLRIDEMTCIVEQRGGIPMVDLNNLKQVFLRDWLLHRTK
jgi:hypothetical protein